MFENHAFIPLGLVEHADVNTGPFDDSIKIFDKTLDKTIHHSFSSTNKCRIIMGEERREIFTLIRESKIDREERNFVFKLRSSPKMVYYAITQ